MISFGGNGSGGVEFEYKHIIWAIVIIISLPILMPLCVSPADASDDWQEEVNDIEETYYLNSGKRSNTEMNIWTLKGIYTPYNGTTYGYTDDGWLYGELVTSTTPSQYSENAYFSGEKFTATRNSNGLYYYSSPPSNSPDITTSTVYSAVTMDKAHKSDVFLTSTSKTETNGYYYYTYTGYRYAFGPLSDYTITKDGTTYDVASSKTSCSLIWYEYQTLSGITGQLTISANDYGVSYLGASDIIQAYNSTNLSATFDMWFGNVPMHLLIRLNPYAIASGMSIADAWNGGLWSVMVYSDQDAASATVSQSWEFSPSQILDTVIALFSFDVAEEYNLDGWTATLASLTFSVAMYAALIAIALNHAYLWILVAAVAILQGMKFW